MTLDNRALDFLHVNDRPDKPRDRGKHGDSRAVLRPDGAAKTASILDTMGHDVDIYKLSGGSLY